MVLDNVLVQDLHGLPFDDPHQLERLDETVTAAAAGEEPRMDRLEAKALTLPRAEAFPIRPAVFIDNKASNRYTLVQVNARDRSARLSGLDPALSQSTVTFQCVHIPPRGPRGGTP